MSEKKSVVEIIAEGLDEAGLGGKGLSREHMDACNLANAAPDLLAALQALSTACGEANALQHAGLDVPPKVWAEMYQADNEARAVIAKGNP